MRGVYNRRDLPGAGQGPPLNDPSAPSGEPVNGVISHQRTGRNEGRRSSIYGGEKVYLGVRVKMPVRDLLKNIRVPKDGEPDDFTERSSNKGSGNMKRARTRARNKARRTQCPVKSLEELAAIIEVLEDDLRTGCISRSPSQNPPPSDFTTCPELSPPDLSNGDEYDEIIPSPESYMVYSPSTSEHDAAFARPDCMFLRLLSSAVWDGPSYGGREDEWLKPRNDWDPNSSAFFETQLEKEETQLRAAVDADLLATDEHGRTLLHKVVCMGKRAQAYAIFKRMAVFNSLNLKDYDGMTALHYAAKHNQHLMVADLIRLGANVNEKNNLGKSCLHLSAENGYIRVLQVLKQGMMNGLYIDMEATDNSGMSILQCASVALKTNMSEVEGGVSLSQCRLSTLHQEHMMETLKCVLQMDSYLHTAGSCSVTGKPEY